MWLRARSVGLQICRFSAAESLCHILYNRPRNCQPENPRDGSICFPIKVPDYSDRSLHEERQNPFQKIRDRYHYLPRGLQIETLGIAPQAEVPVDCCLCVSDHSRSVQSTGQVCSHFRLQLHNVRFVQHARHRGGKGLLGGSASAGTVGGCAGSAAVLCKRLRCLGLD